MVAQNDKKPLVVSRSEGRTTEEVMSKAVVMAGKGRSSEGEKIQIGQVEVRVSGEGENIKNPERVSGKRKIKVLEEVGELLSPVEGVRGKGKVEALKEKHRDESVLKETKTKGQSSKHRLLQYKSVPEDRSWACSGMVAKITSGDALLSVQQRVADAGFHHVVVTPLGSDRVFIHCNNKEDVWKVFNDAIDFFGMLFSDLHQWSAGDVIYERGAWLRVYGTPIHAWNINFFKVCVKDCGRFLNVDECTSDRGRLDFARVLISTSSVDVLNLTTELLIDGHVYAIKLVEEWGCCLGEDAFLTEDVTDDTHLSKEDVSDHFGEHGSATFKEDVEVLFDDIQQAWEVPDDGLKRSEAISPTAFLATVSEEQHAERNDTPTQTLSSPFSHQQRVIHVSYTRTAADSHNDLTAEALEKQKAELIGCPPQALPPVLEQQHHFKEVTDDSFKRAAAVTHNVLTTEALENQKAELSGCPAQALPAVLEQQHHFQEVATDCFKRAATVTLKDITAEAVSSLEKMSDRSRIQFQERTYSIPLDQQQREYGTLKGRSSSCPPKTSQSTHLGPRSLEWCKLNSVQAKRSVTSGRKNSQQPIIVKNNKEGGTIKLSVRNLKRVARMPVKDRGEILKILKIQAKRRKGRHLFQPAKLKSTTNSLTSTTSSNNSSNNSSTSNKSTTSNDWANWVILKGKAKTVDDDVVGIGRAIGVNYSGDSINSSKVLSKEGRRQLRDEVSNSFETGAAVVYGAGDGIC